MIKLKVYVPQDGPYGLVPEEGGAPVEEETCYLKSEVDRVIAEKDAKIKKLEKCKRWLKLAEKFKEAMPIEVKTYKEAESGNSKRED